MTVGGVGQDEQHVLAGLRICGGGGGVETGLGGGGGGGGCGAGVTVGGLQPLGTVHINFYTSKPHTLSTFYKKHLIRNIVELSHKLRNGDYRSSQI